MLQAAAEAGDVALVKVLLTVSGVTPAENNNYAISLASANGHVEVFKVLLADSRVNPAAFDNCAIRWASKNGHVEVVKLLLADPRVDPTKAIVKDPSIAAVVADHGVFVARHASCGWNTVAAVLRL